jgi:hypothetical protein
MKVYVRPTRCLKCTAYFSVNYGAAKLLDECRKDAIQALFSIVGLCGFDGAQPIDQPGGQPFESRETSWPRNSSATEEEDVTAIALLYEILWHIWPGLHKEHEFLTLPPSTLRIGNCLEKKTLPSRSELS